MSNFGFQKHNIDKMVEGTALEDVDTDSHIDKNLSMSENIDKLEKEFDTTIRNQNRNSADARRAKKRTSLKVAKQRHSVRSDQAKVTDNAKKAERVFEPPLSDGEFDKWADNPDEYDVKGVDFFG